jgi:hypothetical protein
MRDGMRDWLKVVYGAGLEIGGGDEGIGTAEIAVRQSGDLSAGSEHGEERRVRVTVAPSDPGQSWRLYLRDLGPGPSSTGGGRVWWRVEPGTWQPLGGTRQCVAEGRGRVRMDVVVRLESTASGGAPRLRLVAEAA